ncbi:FG-GAP repeat domain-containing protein [Sorangium sp. So ce1335]|uniref:FG-GAP repeat domain-containing protein n=1 Tax=Sorangium sp. So ce1335 TaxID=3133335 RepID=UPI003F643816
MLIGLGSGCEPSVFLPDASPQGGPAAPPQGDAAGDASAAADAGAPDTPLLRGGGGPERATGAPVADADGDRCSGPFPGEEPADGSGYYLKPGLLYPVDSPGVYMGQLALGDVDGDRRFDFVSTDRRELYLQTHPRVQELNGRVVHTPSIPADTIEGVLLLDADHDGELDVVSTQGEGPIFLRNQGGGVFEPPRPIAGPTTFSPSAVDHDGDGNLDIVGSGYDSRLFVYLGDGHGNFELTHDQPAGVFLSRIVAGDVTGDGLPDAVIAMSGAGTGVAVFPHDGARGFDTTGQRIFFETSPPSSGVSFVSVAVGDMNNDGRQDVAAVTHEHTDGPMRAWILLQDDLGKLTAPQLLLTIDAHQSAVSAGLQIADLNLDGRSDLVVVSSNTAEMWALIQTPEGTFDGRPATFPSTSSAINGFAVGVTDFDCNGCPDVVGVERDGLVVFRGRGCATAP